jgi:hypothetical protein
MKIKLPNGNTIKVKKLNNNKRKVILFNEKGERHLFFIGDFAGNYHYRNYLECDKSELLDTLNDIKNIRKIRRPSIWMSRVN